ncbi:hypothetical protein AB6A40_009325 [Gnathostoma spinigerum]|uniref:G-protein coupled receptors family 1 profile domain-containing protein n=1 Tax=Gnathostoma spinigerum TaxID=75299 RepID=A0ABD6EYT0_9BILA
MGCLMVELTDEQRAYCFKENYGNFIDACQNKCYIDMQIMPLFHNFHLERIVYGTLFPILVTFVVLANVMVVIVLSKKYMITPTNVVLKYMAIADLCVGLVPLPWTFFYHTLGNNEKDEHIQLWWCYMYKYCMDAIPPVFHNIAMWLTILLAGQR